MSSNDDDGGCGDDDMTGDADRQKHDGDVYDYGDCGGCDKDCYDCVGGGGGGDVMRRTSEGHGNCSEIAVAR